MEKPMKYEAAMEEIESIVSEMESGQLELDELTKKLKRAQTLIALCKQRLTQTDDEVKKILNAQN